MSTGRRTTRRFGEAFTLVEMLVVLTIIAIVGAVVLPSMVGLFTAGSDANAYNVLSGQLTAARGLAIQERTYAGLHAQLADPNGRYTASLKDTCFTAVVQQVLLDPNDPNSSCFVLAEGFSPQKMPGTMAFGRVDSPFYSGGQYVNSEFTGDGRFRFTSLTFVFTPSGQLQSGQPVRFFDCDPGDPNCDPDDPRHALFADRASRPYLWDPAVANNPNCNSSVIAAVMFDWLKFFAAADRGAYLDQYGQIIAVNRYTGMPLGR